MTEEEKSIKDKKAIESIIDCYQKNEEALVNQLHFNHEHGTTIGTYREHIWKSMFEQIIPKKFAIEQSVFIIDSNNNISNEVDLAIFDDTYTPYIFQYGKIKFIPIEAVAVVVECKSKSHNNMNLKTWVESIEKMETSLESYTRITTGILNPYITLSNNKEIKSKTKNNLPLEKDEKIIPLTQTRTRPLRIFCCLNNISVTTKLGNAEDTLDEKLFDIIIRATQEDGLEINFHEERKTLYDWYLSLNHFKQPIDDDESIKKILSKKKLENYQVHNASLLSLNLQLNQLLMLINNPIPFPHIAYAEMFNDLTNGESLHE